MFETGEKITFKTRTMCSCLHSIVTSLNVEGDDLYTLTHHAFEAMWKAMDWYSWTEFEVEGRRFKVRLHGEVDDDSETCMDVEAAGLPQPAPAAFAVVA